MRGFILVGGLGTRLRSIGIYKPKPMIEIGGKPFLEYLIRILQRYQITEIVLCVGFGAEVVQHYFKDGSQLGVTLFYSKEKNPLGTGGAIKNAEEFAVDENLILNGDSFFDVDFQQMLEFHRRQQALVTIACTPADRAEDFGTIQVDENQKILSFTEKVKPARKGLINGGIYLFGKAAFQMIPAGSKVSIENDTFPEIVKTGQCSAWTCNGFFLDIGTPERLSRAKMELPDFFNSRNL